MISLPISELLFSRARVGEKAAKRKREGKRRRRGRGGGDVVSRGEIRVRRSW